MMKNEFDVGDYVVPDAIQWMGINLYSYGLSDDINNGYVVTDVHEGENGFQSIKFSGFNRWFDSQFFKLYLPPTVQGASYKTTPLDDEQPTDKGKHYRYSFRLNLTEEDIKNGFVNVNIDPYRISEVYGLGGWREHVFKKTLRGTEKGHTTEELIEELQCCLDRAKQMQKESKSE